MSNATARSVTGQLSLVKVGGVAHGDEVSVGWNVG